MKYGFNDINWINDFHYAYAPHTKEKKTFTPVCGDSIENLFNESINEHDYISVISKKKYTYGVKARLRCAFTGTGAPLIVFTDDMTRDGEFMRYGLHFEAVLYSGGVNAWRIIPCPENVSRPIKSTNILKAAFPVKEDTEKEITVTVEKDCVRAEYEGKVFSFPHDGLSDSFHIGFTACEGYCRFYGFEIEDGE